ncbi:MAG: efflux RND transporter permease subunit [Acidobacteria bacterium]|jgi:multidrug efflux pump subunit AcrB|nr:efflux RND transporter permease subunit [Bryobacteraceae bacterium CoA2 C42]
MRLVTLALRRPVTIFVAVLAIVLAAWLASRRIAVDIFPEIGQPAIFVAQPYGGMDPSQMEGYLTYYYEYHFLYIAGIEHVESKNIQGASLMKLYFHPGTDMAQAMAQVIGYVTRSRAFMPPGVVGPFITRFDGGSVPVGQLIFSSPTRPPAEMQDIALNRVRPLFATLPGVSAPPPFGGNQRTIVVRLDPDKLRSYRISPEEAIAAVNRASSVQPAGNIRIGDLNHFATSNAALGANLPELLDAPVRPGENPPVFLRDIGVVENGADILTAYAHVNGKRTVYMQITKRSDASTLDVIRTVRANLAAFKTVCPEDVDVRVEFDQSTVVTQALSALGTEAVLGAVLTGLMVLLFLRDWRSSLIVITTIPVALLSALVGLWGLGQTINIMTLGGLALAVGVLVDEATVEIENIHTHMTGGLSRVESVLAACRKTATARLLSMLTILAVFAPALFLTGVGRQLFVPLSLAVALAMAASYVLSSTLVPVLAAKFVRPAAHRPGSMLYSNLLGTLLPLRWVIAPLYLLLAAGVIYLVLPGLGTELFPAADAGQFKLRLRARTGTRIERTEEYALQALQLMQREVPVAISSAFIGVQPASYPINTIFLWTSGPHEAVFQVALKPEATLRGEALRERLRAVFAKELPQVQVSFEAGDIVSDVLSFGSPTPVEVAIQGPALPANRAHAEKVMAELRKLPALRDLQFAQPLDYPTVDVQIDRERAGQYGLTMANVARSLVAATSSSRFVDPNYWRDPNSGNAFQIQVEIPQHRMASVNDLADLPVMQNREARPTLGDVATIKPGKTYGLVERYNMQRVVSITANLHNIPLGEAEAQIRAAIRRAGEPARGVTVQVRGQVPALNSTLDGLRLGLAVAIAAILLLLTAYFQSLRLALVVLSTVPAVLAGVVLALRFTGTTLNLQSFMGAIMATGIAIANSILLVTFAELARRSGGTLAVAAAARLRAVLMTAFAMMAGMTPMALGAAQTAPLGRAVLGGLALATVATLTVVPLFYNILQPQNARDASLLPHEENS